MIITRETDYATRILRSLTDMQLKNIREISDDQLIPRQFAYKISKKMEKAGYIEIVRGAQGGCRLIRDLHDITLMDLITVMDRENMVSSCLESGYFCPYRKRQYDGCSVHNSLCQIQHKLTEYFSTFTLYDMMFNHADSFEMK
ncbi:Rrf2 family transcriptional regulator [Megasphaera cerevisiae DSM 20462]|uniref:Rrf2 family transcriptional regulator n=1 Tax=Megasphaera cerevisiae DSM 20462 TaxID=1122219 RepID=A0A0J6WR65_9FIRM|nr:Rrf2 family transcriptional regulator [Megasphaera cerevisiae]KMO85950.1 Rrf2 family transcriptional regulator [Megasphaera cerevisiae DSM 20462]MCI1750030.1 Rrf2 family transcriptional regulator [Megasphaera cerevisiae]OKY53615.1 Rrf2 family transcriptional regulator [Megasphaera cerevisiae]SJZ98930.1 transcriptional regulator, BadM/Rrf2 family [Megasphaera cerevisiae DSM 20462]